MDRLKRVTGKALDEALANANISRSVIEDSFSQLDQILGVDGKTPIAGATSAGQPPVSPAPSLSSGESSAVEKTPVVASEGE
jgi:hypothetical protein